MPKGSNNVFRFTTNSSPNLICLFYFISGVGFSWDILTNNSKQKSGINKIGIWRCSHTADANRTFFVSEWIKNKKRKKRGREKGKGDRSCFFVHSIRGALNKLRLRILTYLKRCQFSIETLMKRHLEIKYVKK